MGPWWVNAIAGIVCIALGINFIAQAYGLRLGGKPAVADPSFILPLTQNNLPPETRHLTSDEQRLMNEALRASGKIVHKPTE